MVDGKLLYELIGRRIREVRDQREEQMSQQQLADILGLTRTSVTNIEQGNQKITLEALYKFCNHFKIEVKDLLPRVDMVMSAGESVDVEVGDKWHKLTPKTGA